MADDEEQVRYFDPVSEEAWHDFMHDCDDEMLPSIIRIDSSDIIFEEEKSQPSFIGHKYLKGELLGDGSYSKVKEVLDVETLCRRAVKIVKMRNIRRIPNGYANVKREIKILKRLRHINVIELVEEFFSQEKQKLYIVLEYCCCNLQVMLDEAPLKVLPEWQAHYYFTQLIDGLQYLHSRGVIHKDIKPGNLLLTINQVLKITDLGVSEELDRFAKDDTISTSQGSPVFQAPEIADGSDTFSGYMIDIWSCGISLYRMCTPMYPFDGATVFQLYENISKGEYAMPDSFSDDLKVLVSGLLARNSDQRLTIPQIRKTDWFKHQKTVAGEPVMMPSSGNPAFTMTVLSGLRMMVTDGSERMSTPNYDSTNEMDCSRDLPQANDHMEINNISSNNGLDGAIASNNHIHHEDNSNTHRKHKKQSKRCVVC